MDTKRKESLELRIARAAHDALVAARVVTPVDVLMRIGWLMSAHVKDGSSADCPSSRAECRSRRRACPKR